MCTAVPSPWWADRATQASSRKKPRLDNPCARSSAPTAVSRPRTRIVRDTAVDLGVRSGGAVSAVASPGPVLEASPGDRAAQPGAVPSRTATPAFVAVTTRDPPGADPRRGAPMRLSVPLRTSLLFYRGGRGTPVASRWHLGG